MEVQKIKISEEKKELLRKGRNIPNRRRLKSDQPEIKYGIIPEGLLRNPSVPFEERLLFGIIHSYAKPKELEKTPRAYEKVETYAECLGRHRTTTARRLRNLHERGWITVRRRYAGMTNMILLHPTKVRR